MIALLSVVQDSVSQGQQYASEGLSILVTGGVGVLGSLLLGLVKRPLAAIGALDSKIAAFIKPFQPVVLMALGYALPLAAAKLGLIAAVPSAELFAQAPLAAIIGVTAREAAVRLQAAVKR